MYRLVPPFVGWYTTTYVPSSLFRQVRNSTDSRGHTALCNMGNAISAAAHDQRIRTRLEFRSTCLITSSESQNASAPPIRGSRDESKDSDSFSKTLTQFFGELRMTTLDIMLVSPLRCEEGSPSLSFSVKTDIPLM